MNIEDIKQRVGLRAHMKTLCNAPRFEGSINYSEAEGDVIYLLSIIEQLETTLKQCRAYNNSPKYDGIRITTLVDEALQAIRGN